MWDNVLFGIYLRYYSMMEEGQTKGAESLANYQRQRWQILVFKPLELQQ